MTYKRAYYSGCKCGKGHAPLDEHLRLNPGAVTIGLARLLAWAGIQFSYEKAQEWLREFPLFEVSENTIRQETERMGRLQAEIEQEWVAQSQSETWLQERQRQSVPAPDLLYCAIDAAKARTEPCSREGQPKPPHEDWRDVKALVWFETEPVPPAQRNTRQQRKAEQKEIPLRAVKKRYACDITDAETFGKLLWATGCQAQADRVPRLVFLGDGAPWIWNLVQTCFPHAVQIVDRCHAEEHLEKVARQAFLLTSSNAKPGWRTPGRHFGMAVSKRSSSLARPWQHTASKRLRRQPISPNTPNACAMTASDNKA